MKILSRGAHGFQRVFLCADQNTFQNHQGSYHGLPNYYGFYANNDGNLIGLNMGQWRVDIHSG